MKELIERLEMLFEASGSVQTGESFITYKQDGDRIDYVIWSPVLDYHGTEAADGAIYIHTKGRAPDTFEELLKRQKMTYGVGGHLMRFQGKENEYPYTTGKYRGDVKQDIKKMRGYETVRISDGKKIRM
jgi:hypothetical protein